MPEIKQVSFSKEIVNDEEIRKVSFVKDVDGVDEVSTFPIDEDTYNDAQAQLQDLADKVAELAEATPADDEDEKDAE